VKLDLWWTDVNVQLPKTGSAGPALPAIRRRPRIKASERFSPIFEPDKNLIGRTLCVRAHEALEKATLAHRTYHFRVLSVAFIARHLRKMVAHKFVVVVP